MKSVFLFGLVFSLALLVGPAHALEPFVPYDNFNTIFLNPDKWIGSESNSGVLILENSRENVLGHLHFRSRAYSGTASDSGYAAGGTRLVFAEADKVTAIKAKIQVFYVEAKGCATNPQYARAAVRLGGYFFNTGTPTPGNGVNDVLANVTVQRRSDSTDKPQVLKVVASIVRCVTANCSATAPVSSVDLGTTSLWSTVSVSIQWDKDNHQFIFTLDGHPKTYIPYNLPDTSPPGLQNSNSKRIEAQGLLPNCTGEPQPVAFIDAFLDDVYVNQGAAP
jgi:hypothetical protein